MRRVFTEEENKAWSKTLPGKMCSACLVIMSPDNKVLMVKANYKNHWTFPSGIVDENESPKSAAIRETAEETGIKIDGNKCIFLTVVYSDSSTGGRDRFNFAFRSKLSNKNIKLAIPNDEIEKAEFVDIKDIASRSDNKGSYTIFQKILSGEVNDKYAESPPSNNRITH